MKWKYYFLTKSSSACLMNSINDVSDDVFPACESKGSKTFRSRVSREHNCGHNHDERSSFWRSSSSPDRIASRKPGNSRQCRLLYAGSRPWTCGNNAVAVFRRRFVSRDRIWRRPVVSPSDGGLVDVHWPFDTCVRGAYAASSSSRYPTLTAVSGVHTCELHRTFERLRSLLIVGWCQSRYCSIQGEWICRKAPHQV